MLNFFKQILNLVSFGFAKRFRKQFGFKPKEERYFKAAFTHRSSGFDSALSITGEHNERLEYLGDAILSSVISEALFYKFPDADEGSLTKMRSDLVNRKNLNEWGKHIGIDNFLQYDKSLDSNQQFSDALYGNAFEAFIGAIFLDRGYDFTKDYLLKTIIEPFVDFQQLKSTDFNYKSILIEWAQKEKKAVKFSVDKAYEDESKKTIFQVSVWVDNENYGQGKAYRKKSAEQEAAREALEKMGLLQGA